MNQSLTTRLAKILAVVVAVIIVLLPFNEFLTTWIASNFGHLDFWRVYKEFILVLTTPFIVYLIWQSKVLRKWFTKSWIVRLIIAYSLLSLVVGLWAYKTHRVNLFALTDGFLSDVRFLVFFIFVAIIAHYKNFLKTYWRPILIWPSVVVVIFALAQLFLPINFLSHFGYGAHTIPAYSTVDQNLHYRRLQSTLRGANPLGAYLVLIIPAIFLGIFRNKRLRSLKFIWLALSLITLFFTYSRSAYVGVALALALLVYWVIKNPKRQKQLLVLYVLAAIVAVVGVVGLRYDKTAENVFFHTDTSSHASLSSNAQRTSALKTGLTDLYKHPLGGGPGSAGPTSAHNNHPAKIAENYFVQVGQESGWLGLVLFLAINALVAFELWKRRADALAQILLASLVGISFVGLVSHVWADDTLSLLWWGLAGIALSPGIINSDRLNIKNHEKIKKTAKSKSSTSSKEYQASS